MSVEPHTIAGRAPRLAVLIDADNVRAVNAEAILNEIASFGDPSLRRVYGDWSSSSLGQWKEQARNLGLVMHQQSANTKGKNASDIGLVIDAMDILHAGKVDGFQVIGIGEAKTPESLRKVCNRFVLIENIVNGEDATLPPAPTDKAEKPTEPRPEKQAPSKVIPLILDAMRKIDPDQDWYALGQLGQLHTDFDPRSYGSAKLSDLLKKSGRFEVKAGPNNSLIVCDKA